MAPAFQKLSFWVPNFTSDSGRRALYVVGLILYRPVARGPSWFMHFSGEIRTNEIGLQWVRSRPVLIYRKVICWPWVRSSFANLLKSWLDFGLRPKSRPKSKPKSRLNQLAIFSVKTIQLGLSLFPPHQMSASALPGKTWTGEIG